MNYLCREGNGMWNFGSAVYLYGLKGCHFGDHNRGGRKMLK